MHTTVATVLQCAAHAGIEVTEDQQAAFVRELERALGGEAVYFPKRAARPCGLISTTAGYSVQTVQQEFKVSRRTAYRWIGRK